MKTFTDIDKPPKPLRRKAAPPPKGTQTRQQALQVLKAVLRHKQPLNQALERVFNRPDKGGAAGQETARRDRSFVRALSTLVLRRYGQLQAVFNNCLNFPLRGKTGDFELIMLLALAQLLFLQTPLHAVAAIAKYQTGRDPKARHLGKLLTAVLRRAGEEGPQMLAAQDAARLNTPTWLWQHWEQAYGEAVTRKIALANLREAPLDLTVKSDPERWAKRLGGRVLPTGTVRLELAGQVEELPGFDEGQWWVQDAASALPVRLFGDITGARVADLCAAPGGKTAQLCVAGAKVTAIDNSPRRMARLQANLKRLNLQAETVIYDLLSYQPETQFDAILLDAPCTATGTMRRHPDLPHLKGQSDLLELVELQQAMLARAVNWLKPGGRLVYCTCSLQPEEGEEQVETVLETFATLKLVPLKAQPLGFAEDWITDRGLLRLFPFQAPDHAFPDQGMDGFFAACFEKLQ